MDNQYMTKVATSFLEELTEIEKLSFLGGLAKGFSVLGRLGAQGAKKVSIGGLARGGRAAYRKGAAGGGGVMGGLKGFARSAPGQAAGAASVGGLAGYGAYRGLTG